MDIANMRADDLFHHIHLVPENTRLKHIHDFYKRNRAFQQLSAQDDIITRIRMLKYLTRKGVAVRELQAILDINYFYELEKYHQHGAVEEGLSYLPKNEFLAGYAAVMESRFFSLIDEDSSRLYLLGSPTPKQEMERPLEVFNAFAKRLYLVLPWRNRPVLFTISEDKPVAVGDALNRKPLPQDMLEGLGIESEGDKEEQVLTPVSMVQELKFTPHNETVADLARYFGRVAKDPRLGECAKAYIATMTTELRAAFPMPAPA